MTFYTKNILATVIIGIGLVGCVDTSNGGTSVAVSQNRHVQIINNTGRSVWRLYGSRASTNSWEEDILGSNVLPNGRATDVNFNDGTGACIFDMKVEFENGGSIVQNNVNVCTASSVTFR